MSTQLQSDPVASPLDAPPRVRPGRTFLLGLCGLFSIWILVMPPFSGSDEFDHAYRAASAARGEWMIDPVNATRGTGAFLHVPADIVDAARRECQRLRYTVHSDCVGKAVGDERIVSSGAGRYHPLFYAVIGTAARPFHGAAALYAMRFATAALAAAFLALPWRRLDVGTDPVAVRRHRRRLYAGRPLQLLDRRPEWRRDDVGDRTLDEPHQPVARPRAARPAAGGVHRRLGSHTGDAAATGTALVRTGLRGRAAGRAARGRAGRLAPPPAGRLGRSRAGRPQCPPEHRVGDRRRRPQGRRRGPHPHHGGLPALDLRHPAPGMDPADDRGVPAPQRPEPSLRVRLLPASLRPGGDARAAGRPDTGAAGDRRRGRRRSAAPLPRRPSSPSTSTAPPGRAATACPSRWVSSCSPRWRSTGQA